MKRLILILGLPVILVAFQNCAEGGIDEAYIDSSFNTGQQQDQGSSSQITISGLSLSTAKLTGENFNLSVSASGADDLIYQWNKDGVPMAGANSASYDLTNLVAEDGARYTVTISSASLNLVVTSDDVVLTVNINPIKSFDDPAITFQDNDYKVYTFTSQTPADAAVVREQFCQTVHSATSVVESFTIGPTEALMRYALYRPLSSLVNCSDANINQGQVANFCMFFLESGFNTTPYSNITCRIP